MIIYFESRSWNVLQKTLFLQIVFYDIYFISAFFAQRARRSQPKHFTALNSQYYIYGFIQGSLCLHQPRRVNSPGSFEASDH